MNINREEVIIRQIVSILAVEEVTLLYADVATEMSHLIMSLDEAPIAGVPEFFPIRLFTLMRWRVKNQSVKRAVHIAAVVTLDHRFRRTAEDATDLSPAGPSCPSFYIPSVNRLQFFTPLRGVSGQTRYP